MFYTDEFEERRFHKRLKEWMTAHDVGYIELVRRSGIDRERMTAILEGERRPTDEDIDGFVLGLGEDGELAEIWYDLDKIGEFRVWQLVGYLSGLGREARRTLMALANLERKDRAAAARDCIERFSQRR